MKEMTVDIIIPTYRPDEKFEELLGRLDSQTYPIEKILVINTEKKYWEQRNLDKKTTGENSLCKKTHLEVQHIKAEEFDHGGTRAMAAELCQGDVLLYMTQDAMPADAYLVEHLVNALKNEKQVAAAYARQLPAEDCNICERYVRAFNYPEESKVKTQKDLPILGIKTYFCSDVCAAYRRESYEKLGGFERQTIFNEDMIFAARLIQEGYAVAYEARAKVIHSHNYSGLQQFHRNFDLAVSQADHPEIFGQVKSESEGIRLVKNTATYLLREKKAWMLPTLIWQSGWKYLGYCFGKNYRRLPRWMITSFTMNKKYWKNKFF